KIPRSWNISAQQTGTPGRQQNDPKVGCGTACIYGDQHRFLSSLPLMMIRDHFDLLSMNQTASQVPGGDRKSTRLNSSHVSISYAVFCLKKKKPKTRQLAALMTRS